MKAVSAFEADYRAYYGVVSWALRQFPALDSQIDDILQDVFLSYWQHRDTIATEKKKAWLVVTARHKAIDSLRRARKRRTDLSDFQTTEPRERLWMSDPEHEVRVAALSKMLDDLPRKTSQDALVRHYRDGQSFRAIADELRVPLGTIAARVCRARERLRLTFRAGLEALDNGSALS